MDLIAYRIHDVPGFELEPAEATRPWMDASPSRFAYRCLPLVIANQFGWVIRCPASFEVYWNGDPAPGQGLKLRWDEEPGYLASYVQDHFGMGILTFSLPYLFRTEAGQGLLVRGPTNAWVANAHPLDGYVETEWPESTFTMNWKLAEPNKVARFEKGFPFVLLQPYPRSLLEVIAPKTMPLAADAELAARHARWAQSRTDFNQDPQRQPADWQKDYFQGKTVDGQKAPDHATRLALKPFEQG